MPSRKLPLPRLTWAAAALSMGLVPAMGHSQLTQPSATFSQTPHTSSVTKSPEETLLASVETPSMLPDAPGFSSSEAPASNSTAFGGQTRTSSINQQMQASRFAKTIQPGQATQKMSTGDKVLLGFRENLSYISLTGWLVSAGYAQAVNGSPNYGQTGKGFAQRLGAAAARGSSENVFSDSVIAPILHQDPRYYRMGSGHNFVKRLVYSGTRGLISRTDGGRSTINFANIGGDLGGSALTQFYYPPLNRSFTQVMQTWGGSIGGDALGYLVSEFFPGFQHKSGN